MAKKRLTYTHDEVQALLDAVIETIKVNGVAQAITDRAVDIQVPTKLSDLVEYIVKNGDFYVANNYESGSVKIESGNIAVVLDRNNWGAGYARITPTGLSLFIDGSEIAKFDITGIYYDGARFYFPDTSKNGSTLAVDTDIPRRLRDLNEYKLIGSMAYLQLSGDDIRISGDITDVLINQDGIAFDTGSISGTRLSVGGALFYGDARYQLPGNLSVDAGNLAVVRYGTTEYWNQQVGYIPKEGAIIVYTNHGSITENGVTRNVPGIKIGSGNAYVQDLVFVGEDETRDLYGHILDDVRHITAEERTKWNNKLNVNDSSEVVGETLIFNRN